MHTQLKFVSTQDGHLAAYGSVTKEEYELSKAWGLSTAIDLHYCDPDLLKNAEAIKEYTAKVCVLIDAKRGVHATFNTSESTQTLPDIL